MIYKFEDIVINSTKKKKPVEEDKYHYIGLEHLDPGSIIVKRWGSEVAPIGEKLIMKKGDVLFGKRRAYQKKVGVAPFDGIFSAHGMVLRPNESVICKEFLPFFISSERFLNEAIRISVGGLSPTINWKDLKELKFELPSIEEQKIIAGKLWAANNLKESYINLYESIDELIKAEFVEKVGFFDKNNHCYKLVSLRDIISSTYVGEWGEDDTEGTGTKVLRTTNFTNYGLLDYSDVVTRIISEDKVKAKKLQLNDIIIEKSGGTDEMPVGRVVLFTEKEEYLFNNFTQVLRISDDYNKTFIFVSLYLFYHCHKEIMYKLYTQTTGIQNLKFDKFLDINLVIPDRKVQDDIARLYSECEANKKKLNQSIIAIENVIKSINNL